MSINNGISEVLHITSAIVKLGSGKIKDIKFADAHVMLVLWELAGLSKISQFRYSLTYITLEKTYLLSIPYQDSDDNKSILRYTPYNPKSKAQSPLEIGSEELLRQFSKHTIDCEKSFIPAKLELREQTSNRPKEDMRRIVILGEDKIHYKVYKLQGTGLRNEGDADVPMS